ncbi:hypothetical protein L798_10392 [Zootermopsis nevadensis]|uniref:Uncharacterized protein n=1 Tax=Zootermopsis nevadensis TaxID=136037 RepID=A0A067R528_ZOONE|nr:hypothetical protein L798_10392 [Zootermopsis nevadensis]
MPTDNPLFLDLCNFYDDRRATTGNTTDEWVQNLRYHSQPQHRAITYCANAELQPEPQITTTPGVDAQKSPNNSPAVGGMAYLICLKADDIFSSLKGGIALGCQREAMAQLPASRPNLMH